MPATRLTSRLWDGGSGDYRTGPAGDLLRQGAEVIGFCAWREGLVIRPELAASITGVADLRRAGLRVVNWEPGAQARRVLDTELAIQGIEPGQLPGYEIAASVSHSCACGRDVSLPALGRVGLSGLGLARPGMSTDAAPHSVSWRECAC